MGGCVCPQHNPNLGIIKRPPQSPQGCGNVQTWCSCCKQPSSPTQVTQGGEKRPPCSPCPPCCPWRYQTQQPQPVNLGDTTKPTSYQQSNVPTSNQPEPYKECAEYNRTPASPRYMRGREEPGEEYYWYYEEEEEVRPKPKKKIFKKVVYRSKPPKYYSMKPKDKKKIRKKLVSEEEAEEEEYEPGDEYSDQYPRARYRTRERDRGRRKVKRVVYDSDTAHGSTVSSVEPEASYQSDVEASETDYRNESDEDRKRWLRNERRSTTSERGSDSSVVTGSMVYSDSSMQPPESDSRKSSNHSDSVQSSSMVVESSSEEPVRPKYTYKDTRFQRKTKGKPITKGMKNKMKKQAKKRNRAYQSDSGE